MEEEKKLREKFLKLQKEVERYCDGQEKCYDCPFNREDLCAIEYLMVVANSIEKYIKENS